MVSSASVVVTSDSSGASIASNNTSKQSSKRKKPFDDQDRSKSSKRKRDTEAEEKTPKKQKRNIHPSHPDITPPGSTRSSPGHIIPLTKAISRGNMPPNGLSKSELNKLVQQRKDDIKSHNSRVLSRVQQQNADILSSTDETTVSCPDCEMTLHRGSLRYHREKRCRNSRI